MPDVVTALPTPLGSEAALALVCDKRTVQIMHHISAGATRFGALLRAIPTISRRMLLLRLRELERNGLIIRRDLGVAPAHVEYSLTDLSTSLIPHLTALCEWTARHFAAIQTARERFDADMSS